tara:strand:+ start:171 stop:650 length:480 start_codon:yes stop_codon:yes gene_type:complete
MNKKYKSFREKSSKPYKRRQKTTKNQQHTNTKNRSKSKTKSTIKSKNKSKNKTKSKQKSKQKSKRKQSPKENNKNKSTDNYRLMMEPSKSYNYQSSFIKENGTHIFAEKEVINNETTKIKGNEIKYNGKTKHRKLSNKEIEDLLQNNRFFDIIPINKLI